MTLREKILKTFSVTIREINKHGGPEVFFDQYPVGGMYYSGTETLLDENGMEVGTALKPGTLERCKKASKNRLFVCADGCSIPGQTASIPWDCLGSGVSEEDAYNIGKVYGMQLNARGVDWGLFPAIDMYFDHSFPLLAISDDPVHTAKVYSNFIKGVLSQGVCTTAKHFPGLGAGLINMHFAPGQNKLSFDEWMKTYGYTYKEMFRAGTSAVMTTHVALRSYDDEYHDGFYPIATYSEKLTKDLLKGELGFEGVVVTDALIMGGMATGDLIAETVQAFKAGADVLLWPPVEAAEAIEKAILAGEIPMSRLEDALERIERMENFRLTQLEKREYDAPDAEWVSEICKRVRRNSICLLRNEIGLIPLSAEKYQKILVVDATDDSDQGSSEMLKQALLKKGVEAHVERTIYDDPSRVCWQSDTDELQAKYDLVIFNLNAGYIGTWGDPFMLIWNSHLFDKSKKIIVNYGSPYFATDYFPEDPTYIEAYGKPTQLVIDTIVDGLFGDVEFKGTAIIQSDCGIRRA